MLNMQSSLGNLIVLGIRAHAFSEFLYAHYLFNCGVIKKKMRKYKFANLLRIPRFRQPEITFWVPIFLEFFLCKCIPVICILRRFIDIHA